MRDEKTASVHQKQPFANTAVSRAVPDILFVGLVSVKAQALGGHALLGLAGAGAVNLH